MLVWGITQGPDYLVFMLNLVLNHDDNFIYKGQWVFICRIPPPWNDTCKYCCQGRWCLVRAVSGKLKINPNGIVLHQPKHFQNFQNSLKQQGLYLEISKINVSMSGSKTNLYVRVWSTASEYAPVSLTQCSQGSLDRWRKYLSYKTQEDILNELGRDGQVEGFWGFVETNGGGVLKDWVAHGVYWGLDPVDRSTAPFLTTWLWWKWQVLYG